jgi:hypothetical protein
MHAVHARSRELRAHVSYALCDLRWMGWDWMGRPRIDRALAEQIAAKAGGVRRVGVDFFGAAVIVAVVPGGRGRRTGHAQHRWLGAHDDARVLTVLREYLQYSRIVVHSAIDRTRRLTAEAKPLPNERCGASSTEGLWLAWSTLRVPLRQRPRSKSERRRCGPSGRYFTGVYRQAVQLPGMGSA